jgi:hypothetical protein
MRRAILIAALAAASIPADAQAQCVMCFRNAAAQNKARAKALNAGILVLGVPPLLILGGLVWLGTRRRG